MIEIKTYSKPKKTGGSGGSSSPTKYISGVISEAEHAGRADKAKRAEVADQANYAGTAASAQNAAYASEAGNLHADAEILQKYLSLEDTVDPQVVKGMVIFAKGLIAKGLADLMMGAKFGNNAKITELGEAFLSAIKSLDYDNATEQGFSVEKEKNGKYHAFFTNLTIWGKAIFHELEIRKLSYSGGNIYLSGAGSKLIKVVPVKKLVSADGVTTWVEMTKDDAESECAGWKCYLLADNGTTATMNYWQEGDQVRCQTMGEIVSGGTYQNASNKSYWRTIPDGGVSTQNEKIYGTKIETYLDEDGNEQTREVQVELYDGQAFAWIVISKHCDDIDGYDDEFSVGDNGSNPAPLETRDIPSAGDTIVLDGNRHRNEQGEYDKTDRQNVIILETTGEYAPRIACYANITEYKHTFTKSVNGSNKEVSLSVFETSPKGGTKINSSRFEWISDDGSTINIINYRGDWDGNNTYHKNDQVNHNNAVWVCVANSGVDVTEDPSDGAKYWKKVLSGGKGEKGDDAVSYTLEASPGYIRISSDGSIDYTNGYIDKGDEYGSDKYLVVRGYKVVKGVRDNRFSTEASPVTLRLTINDGSAYSEYTPSDGDSVFIDFEPKYGGSYYDMLQEISHSGLNSVRVDMCEGSEYNTDKILATLDIPIVKNGQKGDDGASYNINFVTYKDDVHNDTILYVYVVRSVGKESTSTLISNIPEISETAGLEVRVYCDGDYNENLTNHVKWSGSIQRSAWETVKNFEVRLYLDDKLVSSNSYSFGEQGTDGKDAVSILVEDAPLVFDTDDSGIVPVNDTKTAKVKVMRGNTNVTNDCNQESSRDDLSSNCMCEVTKDKDNKCISVSVKGSWIVKNDVIVDGVNQGKVSTTSGYAVAQFVYDSVVYFAQVPFSVNVAKFTGVVAFNNKQYESKFKEISTKFGKDLAEAESRITQTAREISLSVSEKSVGRRNMLVGSACRKYGDGFMYMSGGYYDGYPLEQIEKNSGIDGVNCIHCRTKQTETGSYFLSGFRWSGNSPQGNIKLEKGKDYVLSFYAKTHTPNDIVFIAEVLYQGSKIDTSRPDGYAGPTGYSTTFSASEADKWELFTVKVSVPSDAPYEYVEINIFARARSYSFVGGYICKPMLEEGENYNGWTLSEQDYDYVGGNLLDNARTLDKSGTLVVINDTVIQNGYGTDSACAKSLMKANATLSDYKEVLRWIFGSTYLVNGNDYIFSFVAKADVDDARVVCYMWSGDIENSCDIFTEGNGGTWDSRSDGNVVFILSRQWTRYWVHWRPKDGYATPKEVIIRHTGNNSASASTVYVTQPKLEIGATMTEWTERKSDLVDKASLKAAGIEITSDMVELYGNQVKVSGAKGGTPVAMFENGMLNSNLINADKIMARQLDTTGSNGQRVSIENGLMQIFGKNGACNIKFGVNDNGEAILSYYDMNGKWLYDLGPNKLDGSQITSSSVTVKEYVTATIKPGTNDFYDKVTYLGKEVKQVKSQYSQLLFGNNMFMNEDDEIKKNSSAHIGYQPFANVYNVTKLYLYSAPRMGNTIVKDDKYGLSTAELAKKADGKYFTSMTMASGGSLVNLAPVGVYFGRNEAVRSAPYPFVGVGSTNDRFPAFTIGGLKIYEAGVGSLIGSHNVFYSYLTRKVNINIIS